MDWPNHCCWCLWLVFVQPLSINPKSEWNTYFKDEELRFDIHKVGWCGMGVGGWQGTTSVWHWLTQRAHTMQDVQRTNQTLHFFHGNQLKVGARGLQLHATMAPQDHSPAHAPSHCLQIMSRILLLYAKLNPGIRYIQVRAHDAAVTSWQEEQAVLTLP